MAATFQVAAPEPFNFSRPEEWTKWIRRFERFRKASGLDAKEDEAQVNTLIYSMGDDADEILRSFALSDADKKKYAPVVAQFEAHFVKRRNIIFERARFNMRRQEEGEPVDAFITGLYALAEHCGYGDLHDEMIRDRIVVGIRNAQLSEKLQLDSELTLEKAVTQVRQSEAIKQQQPLLRGGSTKQDTPVGAVQAKRKSQRMYQSSGRQNSGATQKQPGSNQGCTRCGKIPAHDRQQCPAKDAVCRKCNKKGHFQAVCRSTVKVGRVLSQDEQNLDDVFMGAVEKLGEKAANPWIIPLQLNGKPVEFCIDTGAEVTVISEQTYENVGCPPLLQADRTLRGPDTRLLLVSGQFTATLKQGDRDIQEKVYVVKGLTKPLLGRPAIEGLSLVQCVAALCEKELNPVEQFPHLFQGLGKLQGDYTIKLQEDAKPFAISTPRRVAIPLLKPVKQELQRMEELGVIAKVKEPTNWCAGMVVVPKANGKVRICVDLTRLNQSVCRERHMMPAVDQTLAQLAGAKLFTKLDANSGFWQIPLSPESALLTTFMTPFGRFCFHRLPFGITSAPEHFQRRMSETLSGLTGVVCLIDDVLVYGKTREEHDERLHKVLLRLQNAGVTLNREKCHFAQSRVNFLGHVIDAMGIQPDPDKVVAIQKVQTPVNVGDVRRFLGMANQLSKFSPNLADMTQPLRELLVKGNQWMWGEPQQKAFSQIKEALTTSPVLALFDPNLDTVVSADASSYGLGAVLLQKQQSGELKPVAYISRSMTPTEQRYAQIEKEALAFTWACERLSDYLIGMKFHIHTDHKPLVPLFSSKCLEELPVRVQRFRLRMMRYQFTISHVPGKDLTIADTLSRTPSTVPTSADQLLQEEANAFVSVVVQSLPATEQRLLQIKQLQTEDEACQTITKYCQSGWPEKQKVDAGVKPYYPIAAELSVENGLLMRGCRIVIPPSLRKEMLARIHTGHQGIVKCRERGRQSVWWPGMSRELEELVKNCPECCKAQKQRAQPLTPSELPDLPWQKVATDLFEWKQRMYLIVVDYYSRYVEIACLNGVTAEQVIVHTKSIFARHGIPEVVISDNGPQYTSEAYAKFAKDYQFHHITSSPYFPQSNGEVERAVGTVKNLLKKSDDPYLALLAYRATPLQNGYSPSELLMCRKLRTTVPSTHSQRVPKVPDSVTLREKDKHLKIRQKQNFDSHHGVRELPPLAQGDTVWVPDRESEGTTQEEVAPHSYEVTTADGTYRTHSTRPSE